MTKKKNKFESVIYIHLDHDGDETYMITEKDYKTMNDGEEVAVYELKEIKRAKIELV